jgi:hypothetical protein
MNVLCDINHDAFSDAIIAPYGRGPPGQIGLLMAGETSSPDEVIKAGCGHPQCAAEWEPHESLQGNRFVSRAVSCNGMRKLILLNLLTVAAASAQSLSVGVIGGAPFTDVVKTGNIQNVGSISKSNNFTIGPSLRIGLPGSLRLEVDALYRPYSGSLSLYKSALDFSGQQWRFPALLQYRFGTPVVKPFVEGGLSFNHLSGLSNAAKSITSGPGQLLHQSDAGIVLGAGVDVKIPLFRISGELRYTRRTVSNFANISNLNQAEVLFGIHF